MKMLFGVSLVCASDDSYVLLLFFLNDEMECVLLKAINEYIRHQFHGSYDGNV